ncbi:MAG: PrsW family intramembrane metalloprotease [Chloroflexi bacterium]|nr:PrsW family intramembrane metalloprotease [Chloroflexota bacterium]
MLWAAAGIFLSVVASVLPTVLYALALWWCDRYEREPFALLLAAFLWGAGPAVVLALIGESLLGVSPDAASAGLAAELFSTSALVPLVEESVKGLALVGLIFFFRHEFDGTLDGIVYGGLVGFGFAMTENFFYFAQAFLSAGPTQWVLVVILRGIVFGLNHAFFTALFGAAVGYARHRGFRGHSPWVAVLGFVGAVLFHAAHNLGSTLTAVNPAALALSLASGVGGVLLLAVVLLMALGREREWISAELAQEIGQSLSQEEYDYLTSSQRTAARLGWTRTAHAQWTHWMTELAIKRAQARQRGRDPAHDPRVQHARARLAALRPAVAPPAKAEGGSGK